jgi:hypothetical protein
MADEAGQFDPASNSTGVYREPPPSLGMVAHIWAGHVGSMDADPTELPALGGDGPSRSLGENALERAPRRDQAAALD